MGPAARHRTAQRVDRARHCAARRRRARRIDSAALEAFLLCRQSESRISARSKIPKVARYKPRPGRDRRLANLPRLGRSLEFSRRRDRSGAGPELRVRLESGRPAWRASPAGGLPGLLSRRSSAARLSGEVFRERSAFATQRRFRLRCAWLVVSGCSRRDRLRSLGSAFAPAGCRLTVCSSTELLGRGPEHAGDFTSSMLRIGRLRQRLE